MIGPGHFISYTSSDRLGFFPTNSQRTDEVYEIVLSGWGNTRSAIREANQGVNKVEVPSRGLLSGEEPRPFWASAVDGMVQVGQGHVVGQRLLMQVRTAFVVRHCLCRVFPLPSRLKLRLCRVCSTAFICCCGGTKHECSRSSDLT